MVETRRLKQLADRVEGQSRWPEGPYLVALSGGGDSAALAWAASRSGIARALHVNHGLAGSPVLESAARDIASTLGMELGVVAVRIPDGASLEAQARTIRYQALTDESESDESIVTGHTLDDQAETVLMNLVRGSGVRGIAGIPWHREPNIYRPFLGVKRSDTRELAGLAGLPYLDDPENADLVHLRNRFRHNVLPILRAINPRVDESLQRVAAQARQDTTLLDALAEVPIRSVGREVRVARSELLIMDKPLRSRAVIGLLETIRDQPGATSAEIDRIHAQLTDGTLEVQLEGGLRARIEGSDLVVSGPMGEEEPEVTLGHGTVTLAGYQLVTVRGEGTPRAAPIGTAWALFPVDTSLEARQVDGQIQVWAGGELAWVPGKRRYPVAFYRPEENGYLSVFIESESEQWTSSH